MRAFALAVLLAICAVPVAAKAQEYQRHSDGLVAVHANKLVDRDHHTSFRVCARFIRPAQGCPVEVRLNFRNASGLLLGHASSVLSPESATPTCTSIDLPAEAEQMTRWEISRFRCQRPAADNGVGRARTGG